ncbi:hypothetical protein CHS0354_023709 [Potamilus streckersoni]|uniref:Coenzyme PQQ synthesis protein B n=1 Tax=Potamilus streckersoni TaxID=2493646 RepID=A0AAE0RZH0_9BIVA|nr:hypothetical protein CHS0354_023709 [Potamilus streckersoni]
MIIKVLGSSAGGGFPQWNCGCKNCAGVRTGKIKASPRTQSSIAVSENNTDWTLLNASPDISKQLLQNPEFHPSSQALPNRIRESKIKDVILMDAQIDHVTGLFMLREGCPHNVYCSKEVYAELTTVYPVFNILSHWKEGLLYKEIVPYSKFKTSSSQNVSFQAQSIVSNAPPYSVFRDSPREGDNLGITITNELNQQSVFYAPGLGKITESILEAFHKVDVFLIDGTFATDDEMKIFGENERTAREMGHLPIFGNDGMLEVLKAFPSKRKILIHINNTNPILNEESAERKELEMASIEIAFDEVRRNWIQRIIDHDVVGGGIDCWLMLGKACGLTESKMLSFEYLLPGVKFAVDAYVNFVRNVTWQEAACSSLTELFAPQIHQKRLDTWPTHYKWIEQKGLTYFQKRLSEARRDVEFGLDATLNHFNTYDLQMKALKILQFKLDVLWSMSDAMYLAFVLNKPPYFCCP